MQPVVTPFLDNLGKLATNPDIFLRQAKDDKLARF